MESDMVRFWISIALFVALLLAFLAMVVGLVNPRLVGRKTRPNAFFTYLLVAIGCFIGIGIIAPETELPSERSGDSFATEKDGPVLPGTDSAAAPQAAVDRPAAAAKQKEEAEGTPAVLRSDSGAVVVSDSRTRWDAGSIVAELPSGTDVRLLRRGTAAGGIARCQVRTEFAPRVTGWVMCAAVRE